MNINDLIAIIKKKLQNQIALESILIEDKSFLHKNHAGNQAGKFHLKISLVSKELKRMKRIDSDKKICGEYYKCCWPCLCDVMKYSETKKINIDFKDQSKDIYTIVIDNPCNKNDFPELVNRDYFCEGNELNKEYTYSVDNKLVIGLLHNAKKCDAYDLDYIKNNQITGPMCEARNSMPLEELNFGMGDIFIRLAN